MTAPRTPGPLVESQAVLAPLTDAAIFLVVTVRPDGEDVVRDLLEDLSALQRSVGFRLPAGQLSCVTGIGAEM
jgi:porphyrinogen peroxidase